MGSHEEERERRTGENEAMFRDVNERLRASKEGRTAWAALSNWVCECADDACAMRILMSLDEYEGVRSDSTHFAVAPDENHVVSDAERIVEKRERYWVVEKIGEAAEAAEERDVR